MLRQMFLTMLTGSYKKTLVGKSVKSVKWPKFNAFPPESLTLFFFAVHQNSQTTQV